MSSPLLVVGANGLLGTAVLLEAKIRWPGSVHGTFRRGSPALAPAGSRLYRLDLRDPAATSALLREIRPAVVLQCAGIVKAFCQDAVEAVTVNALVPHRLAQELAPWGGRLIQISTDCVFSGRRGSYGESDTPDPEDFYGRSKLLGEVTQPPHLTVRSSFIGLAPSVDQGLLAWFLEQRGSIQGYRGAIWSGLTSDHLARILVDLALRPEVAGLLHVTGEAVDKEALLRLLAEVFQRGDLQIEGVDEPRVDRSLISERLAALGLAVPPLKDMLLDHRRWAKDRDLLPWPPSKPRRKQPEEGP